ncbi:hypothetical protein PV327_010188 [Microctonus hyperodae]|uniref:Telomerase-binding protein EST1A n=1 Tax=Microctonus hyperodae TaxID=165561 RepID=A0AA39FRD3_MICHY|nr:hypothetical protein PV327_010188 [Microctonus hyperodae]
MGGRRGGVRGCQAIYTPGSGPLKKTGQYSDDYDQEGSQGNISTSSIQNRLKPSRFNTIHKMMKDSSQSSYHVNNELTKKLDNVHVNHLQTPTNNSQYYGKNNHVNGDSKRRFKKPEQPLYMAKKIQDTRDSEQDTNNSLSTQTGWDESKDREENRDQSWETLSTRSKKKNNPHRDNYVGKPCGGTSSNHSSGEGNTNKDDSTKRYLNNRKIRNTTECDDDWRPKSSASNRNYDNRRDSEIYRNIRQGSESPSNMLVSNNVIDAAHIRTRDTRSVGPLGYDKFQNKPPIGRRGYSKGNSINIDALPPRLQRKYLAEIGLDMPLPNRTDPETSHNTYSAQPSSSVLHNSQIIQQSQSNLMQNNVTPTPPVSDFKCLPPQWSNTIPLRSRGRGRFRPEELEGPIIRPGTPDQYSAPDSRSNTPNQEFNNRSYNVPGCDSTMCASVEKSSRSDNMLMPPPPLPSQSFVSLSNKISNKNKNVSLGNSRPSISQNLVQGRTQHENNSSNATKDMTLDEEGNSQTNLSPSKSEPFISLQDMSSDILDWSEEVELSEKLENERLSRSSSVLSLRDNNGSMPSNQLLCSGTGRNRSTYKKKCEKKRISDYNNSREKSRENSRERKKNEHNRENDNFNNIRKNSINKRFDIRKGRNIRLPSRESSKDRGYDDDASRSRSDIAENWRTGKRISICESDDGRSNSSSSHSLPVTITNSNAPPGVLVIPDLAQSSPVSTARQSPQQRKTLFDPNNPNKPIIVPSPGNRVSSSNEVQSQMTTITSGPLGPSQFQQSLQLNGVPVHYIADQLNNVRPSWYDLCVDSVRSPKNTCLLMGIEQADRELQFLLGSGGLTANWDRVTFLRQSLQQSLQDLLVSDMKFCQAENVEQHFWKILFYNIIEMVRKVMTKEGPESREVCKKIMLKVIDDGTLYFENLLATLESAYKFKLDVFLSLSVPPKGLGFVGLALISAQKIFLFLGDLARYKEQANETTNYGKSRQWYMKAQQINPKNGRPYNQLALLAHYARRKLDAVYYYMRSLMASNPFHSARESLIALFDENRKKYESTERKRKEEREWRERVRMKEKEGSNNITGALRREIWIHPGGRRMRRTTSTASAIESKLISSDLEELSQLSSVEVNKRFVTSYLHVHGKLITKIGNIP